MFISGHKPAPKRLDPPPPAGAPPPRPPVRPAPPTGEDQPRHAQRGPPPRHHRSRRRRAPNAPATHRSSRAARAGARDWAVMSAFEREPARLASAPSALRTVAAASKTNAPRSTNRWPSSSVAHSRRRRRRPNSRARSLLTWHRTRLRRRARGDSTRVRGGDEGGARGDAEDAARRERSCAPRRAPRKKPRWPRCDASSISRRPDGRRSWSARLERVPRDDAVRRGTKRGKGGGALRAKPPAARVAAELRGETRGGGVGARGGVGGFSRAHRREGGQGWRDGGGERGGGG